MSSVYVETDPERAVFYGRNGYTKMGAIDAIGFDSMRSNILIGCYSSRRNRPASSAIAIDIPRKSFEAFCMAGLEKSMGLEQGQLLVILELARYPFSKPILLDVIGEALDIHPVEMDHIGRTLEEYMQRWQKPEQPEPEPVEYETKYVMGIDGDWETDDPDDDIPF